jgi:uncharacterized protein YaiI (UPF0178 family)
MKILVDADACPVKDIIINLSKEKNLRVLMFIDESHVLKSDYAEVIQVAKGPDVADFRLVNQVEDGDIVVSSDYGLASMALAKKAKVITFNGKILNEYNIDALMMQRHMVKKNVRAGKRVKGPKKRTSENDSNFEKNFRSLINS